MVFFAGLIQCAIGIFGNVPCPVIYGTVVDSACIVWGMSGGDGGCGDEGVNGNGTVGVSSRGHCWVYESWGFRVYFHGELKHSYYLVNYTEYLISFVFAGTTAFLMFIAFLIDLVVCYHASAINMGTSPDTPDLDHETIPSDNVMNTLRVSPANSPQLDVDSSPLLCKRDVSNGGVGSVS